ncbi:hypothetical protein HPP92_024992 [Vanilla planifolia]|uniref:BHLH domain-containing protein n=1 Tax=Vanilla planifolia TaxID=51239 RepID=A0A835PJ84_VANPL|nr:hypothetical protein HPP92_024992 [Vanilla planifolia]
MLQSKSIVVSKEARARRIISDRKRKAKVAEGFKALQNTLPYSDKGSHVTILGDVIDYIKFLKLRLNVLSQSRLSGEVSAYSFVHCEGYGHYLLHPHSDHELLEGYGHYLLHPHLEHELLEVKIGHLMQSDPQAANELLESKGLALVPLDAAYALLQYSRSVHVP